MRRAKLKIGSGPGDAFGSGGKDEDAGEGHQIELHATAALSRGLERAGACSPSAHASLTLEPASRRSSPRLPARAEAALRAAVAAALRRIPEGRATLFPDPDAPEGEQQQDVEAELDAPAAGPEHNPLASLLGDYRCGGGAAHSAVLQLLITMC